MGRRASVWLQIVLKSDFSALGLWAVYSICTNSPSTFKQVWSKATPSEIKNSQYKRLEWLAGLSQTDFEQPEALETEYEKLATWNS